LTRSCAAADITVPRRANSASSVRLTTGALIAERREEIRERAPVEQLIPTRALTGLS